MPRKAAAHNLRAQVAGRRPRAARAVPRRVAKRSEAPTGGAHSGRPRDRVPGATTRRVAMTGPGDAAEVVRVGVRRLGINRTVGRSPGSQTAGPTAPNDDPIGISPVPPNGGELPAEVPGTWSTTIRRRWQSAMSGVLAPGRSKTHQSKNVALVAPAWRRVVPISNAPRRKPFGVDDRRLTHHGSDVGCPPAPTLSKIQPSPCASWWVSPEPRP